MAQVAKSKRKKKKKKSAKEVAKPQPMSQDGSFMPHFFFFLGILYSITSKQVIYICAHSFIDVSCRTLSNLTEDTVEDKQELLEDRC